MLKDIGKTERVKNVVVEARLVANFLYNHGYVLSLMREKCGGDLVCPELTRESKSAAGQKAEGLVSSPTFWQNCKTIVDILEPIVRVLRMVYGDKKPTMGSMYHAIELMKGAVQTTATQSFQGYHKIIDTRWKNMLLHPLHSAAYYLNPKYQYSEYLETRANLIKNLQTVIQKLEPDANEQSTILSQIKAFQDAVGSFGIASAVAGRANTTPAEWWVLYGTNAPNLRSLAINFLSQTTSSSGYERNWSTFNLIHSKRMNMLGHENLHNLVYVHYNTRLRLKHRDIDSSREACTDPLDLTDVFCTDGEEDPLYEWVKEIGEPLLDASRDAGGSVGGVGAFAGRGGNVISMENDPYRRLSPFTCEREFDNGTQDQDHGARPQDWQSDASQRRHGNRPNDKEVDSLDAHSRYCVDSLTDTFESLSVEGGNSQSHGYGPVEAESGLGSTAYYGYGQYGYEHG
ncbi:uncharacterized protein LOC143882892 [Tasmannia lanceolata]|uniref:uncharacterized protein LOC143882892 n=1 Tax=Tasmannia lanceolata TaxID=3420 RepID=UPI004064486A